ncbi:MAG: sugar ABC transporter permease YjfF [Phycisphaerae bacterium]|nr:sugar ABC transporter permease YjfF [Phycisphaerae bacterium]
MTSDSTHSSGARHLPTMIALTILAALLTFGSIRFDHFASVGTFAGLFHEYSFVGIAALGTTLVILSGGIDLSVGAVVACTSVIIASLVERHGVHPLPASAIAVALGAGFGAAMGGLIERYRLPAFLVTLAGMFVARSFAFWIEPHSISVHHPAYAWASMSAVLRVGELTIPLRTMIFLGAAALTMVIAHATPFGRYVYAIGGNETGARRMSLPVGATRIGTYALAGGCSALAGAVFTLYKQAGDPASAVGLELEVIAAAVIGGILLSGGVGTIAGTIIGVLILGTIRLLIDFQGTFNAAWTSIATGVLLLLFVGLQEIIVRFERLRARAARAASGRG